MNTLTDHEEIEEPCPIYEATDEDWEDFWYNEDN